MEPSIRTDDAELLREFAATGSDQAFTRIVHRHINLVYSTCLRRLGDAHRAEDATQSVFVLLWQKGRRFDPEIVLAGWLFRTARFVCSDLTKMDQRREHHEQLAAVQPSAMGDDQTWRQISQEIDAALDSLPDRDRLVILLRYFQGLNVSDAAERVGIAPNTASKRIERSLEKMRTYFARRGITAPSDVLASAMAISASQQAPSGLAAATAGAARGAGAPVVSMFLKLLIAGIFGAATIATVLIAYKLIMRPPVKPMAAPALPPLVSQSAATGPFEPPVSVSADQDQQIRAAVYVLGHYIVGASSVHWIAAMRTLADIGRPAVPELVAELNRTDKDKTIRAIAFTLRAINDPRACPALITALAKTSVCSSDYGFGMDSRDARLFSFMQRYELKQDQPAAVDQADGFVHFGRAIREIDGALKSITGHSEGPSWNLDSDYDDPQHVQTAEQCHRDFSLKWQQWWKVHQSEFVTDADLASLSAHPHSEADLLAAAGSELPIPTGSAHHLGPVHDVRLHVWNRIWDQTQIIDFDSERVMTLLEAARLLPEPTSESMQLPIQWYSDSGAGGQACCNCLTYTPPHALAPHEMSPLSLAPGTEVFTLFSIADEVWPTDNRTWDTLESQMQSGKPIEPDPRGPYSRFEPVDLGPDSENLINFPQTYLFRTSRGGAGILQLLGSDSDSHSVHFRYRMVQPPAKGFVPRPLPAIAPEPPFGPVTRVTLAANQGFVPPGTSQAIFKFGGGKVRYDLVFRDIAVVRLSHRAFCTLDSGTVLMALQHASASPTVLHTDSDDHCDCAAFRAPDGTAGIFQVACVNDDPPRITIRYKLVASTK